jgi:hypothetical protein
MISDASSVISKYLNIYCTKQFVDEWLIVLVILFTTNFTFHLLSHLIWNFIWSIRQL